ncbi:MAG: hypothetical protein FWD04_04080 [Conexibacteraceae bacterium]|nr:hypothetical protein [Conexibacteraceae bacterium]
MQVPLSPDEAVLRETGANVGRGWSAVRGTLRLTSRRLVFVARDVPDYTIEIPLEEISVAARVYLRGPLGLNNVRSLQLNLRDGTVSTFMVTRPMRWVAALAGAGVSRG